MRKGKKLLAAYVPEELHQRLDESAKRNRRSKTMQLILALERFLDEDEAAAPIESTAAPKPRSTRRPSK